MELEPQINYKHTRHWFTAIKWLNDLPDTIACDFEAASMFTKEDREHMKEQLNTNLSNDQRIQIEAALKSDALSHPYYVLPTHLSIAWSESDAFVIILDNDDIRCKVMNWLVSTNRTQIWHNFGYDGKLIYYWAQGKLPDNIEDSALLAKSLLNHVENWKSNSQLKHLMGYKFGSWAVSVDHFNLENIHNEDLIKYAAIDSCATFALWNSMQTFIKES